MPVRRPCVQTALTPNDVAKGIVNENELDLIAGHVMSYKRLGIPWTEYRKKVPAKLLSKYGKLLSECRRIGYYCTGVYINDNDKHVLKFSQAYDLINPKLKHSGMETLCSRCERICKNKDENGVFKNDYIPCWKESEE